MIRKARQDLGIRIRALRKEQNISLRSFALMIGISKDYLVDLEYGRKSPTFDTIMKIASGLDMSPAQLLEGIGEPSTHNGTRGTSKPMVKYHATKL